MDAFFNYAWEFFKVLIRIQDYIKHILTFFKIDVIINKQLNKFKIESFENLDEEEMKMLETFNNLTQEYRKFTEKNIKLDLSRGKPCAEQLDLSMPMLKIDDYMSDTVDCRNYGELKGVPEAISFFADLFGNSKEEVMVVGNSSLNLMYFILDLAWRVGYNGRIPLKDCRKLKFLCPSPGYDRHFRIAEYLGFELITIDMLETGPNMDKVEEYVKDSSVVGIWCIPVYSNPDGYVYSDETVKRFASLKPASPDFRIFWDNAYMIHGFTDEEASILNLLNESKKYNNEDMVFMFCSTSKMTFAGAGVAALATSQNNIKFLTDNLSKTMICFDKMNQLRHVRFFKNIENLKYHMKKHGEITGKRFEAVFTALERNFTNDGTFVRWTVPKGGYFLSLYVKPGCAKRVVELCKNAGLILTPAGVTYPYGNDPLDSNIRIAPTFATVDEIKDASSLLCLCIKIAVNEKYNSEH